ncbi:MAG: Na/Pi cotransporter family protein [Phycisphaerales bacterium]|nr:Na/Pi cotransporter family protein [Phycisphaerales bacterium]
MIASLLGGLGIFLLGMVLLTDGLKAVAGEALRRILTRYVATPLAGVGWGALVTALVQSSTATTLTTVGFVSAGLLTFTQAVGVIFGANLGTTSTGWIVSQLGFKVSLGSLSPPLVLVGVALRLLCRGRAAHAGTALAGFALLFMGIDLLQAGMASFAPSLGVSPLAAGAGTTPLALLLLVATGFLMTVVMLSSSAAMTATLAAVASGVLGLEQAAVLIIGQNIGTTPKAVAAAIGTPAAAKRTALAHVLFNVVTGAIALAILPWLLKLSVRVGDALGAGDAPTVLAVFHTVFNALGVLVLFPLIRPFAALTERLLPERGPAATRYLAPAVAEVGPVALEAARRAMIHVLRDIVALIPRAAAPAGPPADALAAAGAGRQEIVRFVQRLGLAGQPAGELARVQSLLHAADHLDRALAALRSPRVDAALVASDPIIAPAWELVLRPARRHTELRTVHEETTAAAPDPLLEAADDWAQASRAMADVRRLQRREILRLAAAGALAPDAAMAHIDALLWLDGVAYHLWRATHHLRREPEPENGDPTPQPPPDLPAEPARAAGA